MIWLSLGELLVWSGFLLLRWEWHHWAWPLGSLLAQVVHR